MLLNDVVLDHVSKSLGELVQLPPPRVELDSLDYSEGQTKLVQLDLHGGKALGELGQLAFSVRGCTSS